MSDYLWQRDTTDVDERVMRFLAGEDIVLDRQLFVYDVRASKAHVQGLVAIGVISKHDGEALQAALDELIEAFEAGDFALDERYEDGHSAIEAWLTERLGDAGKRIHTGRSRNDQVLVAMRLYLRDALAELSSGCASIAETCLRRAATEREVPMPGYTHLQRAVVSSVGLWFAAFAEAFIDDAELAIATRRWIDANPLGTAAGFGVNLPLDRELTTRELGFERLLINPLYAQGSRGKFELQALASLSQALLDVRRLAWDVSLFTTSEFGFVELPERFTTGSSIMPNKRNPDLIELLRSTYAVVQGASNELQAVLSLPSGYHRDLQATKGPVLRSMSTGLEAVALTSAVVHALVFKRGPMAAAIEPGMYAADRATELAQAGVPFREAYRQALADPEALAHRRPETSLAERVSAGAPGNLQLAALEARLKALDLTLRSD